jgi:hypothetical protein
MIVDYHPRTASDLNSAVAYYNRQRPNLGTEFRSEIYATIDRIRSNPFQFPVVKTASAVALSGAFHIRYCFASLTTTRSGSYLSGTTGAARASV